MPTALSPPRARQEPTRPAVSLPWPAHPFPAGISRDLRCECAASPTGGRFALARIEPGGPSADDRFVLAVWDTASRRTIEEIGLEGWGRPVTDPLNGIRCEPLQWFLFLDEEHLLLAHRDGMLVVHRIAAGIQHAGRVGPSVLQLARSATEVAANIFVPRWLGDDDPPESELGVRCFPIADLLRGDFTPSGHVLPADIHGLPADVQFLAERTLGITTHAWDSGTARTAFWVVDLPERLGFPANVREQQVLRHGIRMGGRRPAARTLRTLTQPDCAGRFAPPLPDGRRATLDSVTWTLHGSAAGVASTPSPETPHEVSLAPDGRTALVVTRSGRLRRWTLEPGAEPEPVDAVGPVFRLCPLSDGRVLTNVERGGRISWRVLDAHTGRELERQPTGPVEPLAGDEPAAVDRDGHLYVCDRRRLHVFDARLRRVGPPVPSPAADFAQLSASPDGAAVVALTTGGVAFAVDPAVGRLTPARLVSGATSAPGTDRRQLYWSPRSELCLGATFGALRRTDYGWLDDDRLLLWNVGFATNLLYLRRRAADGSPTTGVPTALVLSAELPQPLVAAAVLHGRGLMLEPDGTLRALDPAALVTTDEARGETEPRIPLPEHACRTIARLRPGARGMRALDGETLALRWPDEVALLHVSPALEVRERARAAVPGVTAVARDVRNDRHVLAREVGLSICGPDLAEHARLFLLADGGALTWTRPPPRAPSEHPGFVRYEAPLAGLSERLPAAALELFEVHDRRGARLRDPARVRAALAPYVSAEAVERALGGREAGGA
jgi:hypothetical protein